ncbi:MAG TPA: TonB-dependent receptor [Cyclobacteriaceae bacterium]|nr:TonB-dependent receptor [Cyclobacteriaceae bacterium]HRJ83058.1 TonB-dependent receptor [Cyclobacteriaceae bacterium]
MKMAMGVLAGIVFGLAFQSAAQDAALKGVVRAKDEPIAFATVALRGTNKGTITNADGYFELKGITTGSHVLEVSAVGYKKRTQPVQVNQSVNNLTITLEEDVSQLDEVVVTGTMKEVTKLQSPIPVEVYSPTLFKKNPAPNIFESLNMVNGVQPQINCNVCNTGDIHINGLEGPYTMVLIDGMPIVSSLSTVYGLAGIPNSLVKRIEVVKGPGSTLYGSEAVGGVINIITKEPSMLAPVQVDVFGTSVGEFNLDFSAVKKVGKATALLGVNHFYYDQKRDINNDNFTDVTLQNRFSFFNKWDFKNQKSSIAWRYFYEDRWGGELQWTRQYRGSDVYYGESIYTNRWEVLGTHALNENTRIDYSYNYHLQDSYYGTAKFLADQHVAFAQLRWNKHVGAHDVLAGIPIRFIRYDDNTPGTAELSGDNTPAITFLPGIFIQDEVKLSNRLSSLMGVRYDHHNIHGSIVTPRLSFRYRISDAGVLRVTGGNGYRVVNLFTEDHAALTGAREVVLLDELKPEKSWNLNVNFTQTITFSSGFWNIDASVFYTYFSNKIVGDFLTDQHKIIYDNLSGYAVSQGITLNTDVQLLSGFSFMAGLTIMDVFSIEEEVKVSQLFAPRFSGTLAASYASRNSKWMVDLTGRFNGPMHLPVQLNDFRPAMSPVVPLMNVQVTRMINNKKGKNKWEVYGGIKNLFNFLPDNPLMRPFDPFNKNVEVDNPNNYTFDTAYNYAPVQGLKGFLGVRYTLN